MTSAKGTIGHVDIFDRVIDKGIIVDEWLRVSDGIVPVIAESWIVVVSIETHLSYGEGLTKTRSVRAPGSRDARVVPPARTPRPAGRKARAPHRGPSRR